MAFFILMSKCKHILNQFPGISVSFCNSLRSLYLGPEVTGGLQLFANMHFVILSTILVFSYVHCRLLSEEAENEKVRD